MLDQLHSTVDICFEKMIEDVQTMIRCNSVIDEGLASVKHPFGANLTECLQQFLNIANSLGLKTVNVGNAAGHVEIGYGSEIIGILCHLDTVPFGNLEKWNYPPLSAEIADGKIYGRGAIDDKGPAVAALYALKALKESSEHLNKRFRLIVGLDEESGYSRCLDTYFEQQPMPSFSFSPDADFPVINAEKGILRIKIVKKYDSDSNLKLVLNSLNAGDRFNVVPEDAQATFNTVIPQSKSKPEITIDNEDGFSIVSAAGKSAHAMSPDKGVNALQLLLEYLASLKYSPTQLNTFLSKLHNLVKLETNGSSLGIETSDEVSGELTCNLAFIKTVDNSCTVGFDIRYPVTTNSDTLIEILAAAVTTLDAEFLVEQNKLPLNVSANTPQVRALLNAYESVTGNKGYTKSIGGGTYCRNVNNAVSFGARWPEDEEVGHQPNENISLERLKVMTHIYAEALQLLNRV